MRKFYGWYLAPFKPAAGLPGDLRTTEGFSDALLMIRERLELE
jgi:hypothetical protein